MAFQDLTDEVYEAIKAFLGDGSPGSGAASGWTTCPIAYPNDNFELPNPPSPFVVFEISGDVYGQQSIGAVPQSANRWDEAGRIWLHVMTPRATGNSAPRGAAKQLAKLFRGLTLLSNGLEFLDASIGEGQPGSEDGNWFRISVNIRWRRIEAV